MGCTSSKNLPEDGPNVEAAPKNEDEEEDNRPEHVKQFFTKDNKPKPGVDPEQAKQFCHEYEFLHPQGTSLLEGSFEDISFSLRFPDTWGSLIENHKNARSYVIGDIKEEQPMAKARIVFASLPKDYNLEKFYQVNEKAAASLCMPHVKTVDSITCNFPSKIGHTRQPMATGGHITGRAVFFLPAPGYGVTCTFVGDEAHVSSALPFFEEMLESMKIQMATAPPEDE